MSLDSSQFLRRQLFLDVIRRETPDLTAIDLTPPEYPSDYTYHVSHPDSILMLLLAPSNGLGPDTLPKTALSFSPGFDGKTSVARLD